MDDEQQPVGEIADVDFSSEEAETTVEASLALRPAPKPRTKKQVREKHFSNALVVRRETGEKILVPLEAKDNRHANMVVASMMRELVKTNIDIYKASGEALKPKELADLATAAKLAAELSYRAYEPDAGELNEDGSLKAPTGAVSGLITGMQAIGKGMADGFAEKPQGFAAIMQSLDELGKKKGTAKTVSAESAAKESPVVDV